MAVQVMPPLRNLAAVVATSAAAGGALGYFDDGVDGAKRGALVGGVAASVAAGGVAMRDICGSLRDEKQAIRYALPPARAESPGTLRQAAECGGAAAPCIRADVPVPPLVPMLAARIRGAVEAVDDVRARGLDGRQLRDLVKETRDEDYRTVDDAAVLGGAAPSPDATTNEPRSASAGGDDDRRAANLHRARIATGRQIAYRRMIEDPASVTAWRAQLTDLAGALDAESAALPPVRRFASIYDPVSNGPSDSSRFDRLGSELDRGYRLLQPSHSYADLLGEPGPRDADEYVSAYCAMP